MSTDKQSLFCTKFEGAGNDFVMLNCIDKIYDLSTEQIAFLCNRRFGIGADGLITISNSKKFEFKMTYFNSDGRESSFCGNGGRCIAAYAYSLGLAEKMMTFEGFDGIHQAEILSQQNGNYFVSLSMNDVKNIKSIKNGFLLDTGSPHFVEQVEDLENFDVCGVGRKIRNDKSISANGVNVDFVSFDGHELNVRTYERGVEDETLSCGTGVTASAIAAALWYGLCEVNINTRGGKLRVTFNKNRNTISEIRLIGPATKVFETTILI